MMKKCRLTILKTTLQEDLAKEYGIPNFSTCCSCNDGLRPVIIKVERTDKDDTGE